MTNLLGVRGIELRYLLTTYLFDHGPATVAELIEALTYDGLMHCVGRWPTGGFAGYVAVDTVRYRCREQQNTG